MSTNLNDLKIENGNIGPDLGLDHPPREGARLVAYFRQLEDRLVEHIAAADAVLGCVAWLTNGAVLAALAGKEAVAIVVQKEDFLRPDLGANGNWAAELRRQYDALRGTNRYDLPDILPTLSYASDPTVAAVRCAGNHNHERRAAAPRMHHKFLLFCRRVGEPSGPFTDFRPSWAPYGVWTGSFNVTANAAHSLENAVYLEDARIVEGYVREWAYIEALSEPLDWESEWCAPEWRIGS